MGVRVLNKLVLHDVACRKRVYDLECAIRIILGELRQDLVDGKIELLELRLENEF
jgi:hypothetical protein